MKRILTTIVAILFISVNFGQKLVKFKDDQGNYGFKDENGNNVIQCRYHDASDFDDFGNSFVYVSNADSNYYNGFIGKAVINIKGEILLNIDKLKENFEDFDNLCGLIGPAGNNEYYVCKRINGKYSGKGGEHCKVDINGHKVTEWLDGALTFYDKLNMYVKRKYNYDVINKTYNSSEQIMTIDGTMLGSSHSMIYPLENEELYYVIDGTWDLYDNKTSIKKSKDKYFAPLSFNNHDYYYFELNGKCSVLDKDFKQLISDKSNLAIEFTYGYNKPYFKSYTKAESNTYHIVITKKGSVKEIEAERWGNGDYVGKGKGVTIEIK